MKQTEILTHATHVNGWEPAVYMSCMSQNFRLFHVSNLSVRNFRIFLLMYTGSLTAACASIRAAMVADRDVNYVTSSTCQLPVASRAEQASGCTFSALPHLHPRGVDDLCLLRHGLPDKVRAVRWPPPPDDRHKKPLGRTAVELHCVCTCATCLPHMPPTSNTTTLFSVMGST